MLQFFDLLFVTFTKFKSSYPVIDIAFDDYNIIYFNTLLYQVYEDHFPSMISVYGKEEPEDDPQAEKNAVAIKYDMEKNKAPKLVAKGKGHVAENILEAARKGQVPVYQNKSLVNMLMALELDKEIPTELYTTVAEILAYVYRIDRRRREKILEEPPMKGL